MVRWYRLRAAPISWATSPGLRITGRRWRCFADRAGLPSCPAASSLDVQEAERANVQNNGVDRQFPVSEQVGVITPDIIRAELVQSAVDVLLEISNVSDKNESSFRRSCGARVLRASAA